jgi:hypothetical protein
VIVSCTSSAPHVAHVMFTLIPHLSQVYVAIGSPPGGSDQYVTGTVARYGG